MEKVSARYEGKAKTYIFRVVVEPDDDRWHAYSPVLEEYAASTWGYTREEAVKNIKEVLQMTIESMIEDGDPIPEESLVQTSSKLTIAVTI